MSLQMPRKHKALCSSLEDLIHDWLGIELSGQVLLRDGQVPRSGKGVSEGDESGAIPSGRTRVLLDLSLAPEKADRVVPFK